MESEVVSCLKGLCSSQEFENFEDIVQERELTKTAHMSLPGVNPCSNFGHVVYLSALENTWVDGLSRHSRKMKSILRDGQICFKQS
jgi:hypothetical protein